MPRTQLADGHLTYIGAMAMSGTAYDVYGPQPGLQLGRVYKTREGWTAQGFEVGLRSRPRRTRWEAALELWPAEPVQDGEQ